MCREAWGVRPRTAPGPGPGGRLLAQAARFRQGEALLAGGFVPMPSIVQMRTRVTPQGGTDVPVPMP